MASRIRSVVAVALTALTLLAAGTASADAHPAPQHQAMVGAALPEQSGTPIRRQPTTTADPSAPPGPGGVRWDQFGGTADEAPQDLDSFIDTSLGWLETLAGYAAFLGLLISASLIVIGIKGRSAAAKKAVEGLPAVLVGTITAGSTWTLVTVFTG